jgi:hypothetical protein
VSSSPTLERIIDALDKCLPDALKGRAKDHDHYVFLLECKLDALITRYKRTKAEQAEQDEVERQRSRARDAEADKRVLVGAIEEHRRIAESDLASLGPVPADLSGTEETQELEARNDRKLWAALDHVQEER